MLGCVVLEVPSQISDGRRDVAKNTAISSMIRSDFVVPIIVYDFLVELQITTSEGTWGTADDAASGVVGASTSSATAVLCGTDSTLVRPSNWGQLYPRYDPKY